MSATKTDTRETQNDHAIEIVTVTVTVTVNETVAIGIENGKENVSAKETVIEIGNGIENAKESVKENEKEKSGKRRSMLDVVQRKNSAVQRKVDDILDTKTASH